jgi:hypothetical protein
MGSTRDLAVDDERSRERVFSTLKPMPSSVAAIVEGSRRRPPPMPSRAAGRNDQTKPLRPSKKPPRFASATVDPSIIDVRARAVSARFGARTSTDSTASERSGARAIGQPARRRMEDRRLAPGRSAGRSLDNSTPTRQDREDRQSGHIAPTVGAVGVGKRRRGRRGVLAGATRARARRGNLRDFARLGIVHCIDWK